VRLVKSVHGCARRHRRHIPLLGLVPALEKGNRDEDDNSLASVANLDLRILVSASCCCPVPTASSLCGVVWV
jgi:hypothetical protein